MSDAVVFRDPVLDNQFARNGWVIVPLLDGEDIARLGGVYGRYPREHATPFSASILSRDGGYRRHVYEEVSGTVAVRSEELFDSYRIFMAGFLSKQPDPAGAMPMHQDLTLVEAGIRPAITIWTPLVDVDETNGCVYVVSGSHETNQRPRAAGTPFAYPEIEPLLRSEYLEPLRMRAGESLVLHHSVFHCSPANQGTNERPVAVTVLAPRELPLVYYHRVNGSPPRLERYAVADDFYLHHAMGTRPVGLAPVEIVDETVDPLEPGRFATARTA